MTAKGPRRNDDSRIKFVNDSEKKEKFVKTFNKSQLRLRPTTAAVGSLRKNNYDLMSP